MSATITKHIFDKQRCLEIIDIEDSHGRRHQIQVSMSDPNLDAFIQKEIAEFEAMEDSITEHIEKRFHPKTLERLKPE